MGFYHVALVVLELVMEHWLALNQHLPCPLPLPLKCYDY